ncbi:MAG: hypothetical protein HY695_05940 [Deltaproteobacteria bacterium]|nr:hypothetical protein [Deltaproteobacteria bacterium]
MTIVQITREATGMKLAAGPIGWGIAPIEGNYDIQRKYLATDRLRLNFIPGLCVYKG